MNPALLLSIFTSTFLVLTTISGTTSTYVVENKESYLLPEMAQGFASKVLSNPDCSQVIGDPTYLRIPKRPEGPMRCHIHEFDVNNYGNLNKREIRDDEYYENRARKLSKRGLNNMFNWYKKDLSSYKTGKNSEPERNERNNKRRHW